MPKSLVGEPFSVSLISGIEKFYASEGYVTIFRRNIFCLKKPKRFVEEPSMLCFRKFLVAKKFIDKREGEVSTFPSKIFCFTAPEHFVEKPFYAVSENFW